MNIKSYSAFKVRFTTHVPHTWKLFAIALELARCMCGSARHKMVLTINFKARQSYLKIIELLAVRSCFAAPAIPFQFNASFSFSSLPRSFTINSRFRFAIFFFHFSPLPMCECLCVCVCVCSLLLYISPMFFCTID